MKLAIRLLARTFLNFVSYTMNHHMRMLEKKILEMMPLPHHAYSHIWHRTTTTTIIRNKYLPLARDARAHTPCTISTILGAIIIAGIIFTIHSLSLLCVTENLFSCFYLLTRSQVTLTITTTLLCTRTHDPQPCTIHKRDRLPSSRFHIIVESFNFAHVHNTTGVAANSG